MWPHAERHGEAGGGIFQRPGTGLARSGTAGIGQGLPGEKGQALWAKIVKVLRSVYRAYCDLKSKFERLQADYGREVSKNSSLSERIYESAPRGTV